jgi:hypothetical protein
MRFTIVCSAAFFITATTAFGQTLESRVKSVLPTTDEDRWAKIPWHTNLAEARVEAEKTGKPILFWVMNGNPLGCA